MYFIGDSIVEGKSADSGLGVSALLSAKSPAPSFNLASGGATVVDVATQLREIPRDSGAVLLIGFGVNDSRWRAQRGHHEVPIQEFRDRSAELADNVATHGFAAALILSQVPVIDELLRPYKDDKEYRRSWQEEYEIEKRTAFQGRATYVDVWGSWLAMHMDWQRQRMPDGLHPDNDGHRFLAEHVWDRMTGIGAID